MVDTTSTSSAAERRHRRLIPAPVWLRRFEHDLGTRIGVHPNVLSALKLFLVAPLMFLSLRQVGAIAGGPILVSLLFAAFGLLDYLDGVVARERDLSTQFGRFFDRITDYPLLVGVSYFCIESLDPTLLSIKLGLDGLLLALYLLGRGSTQNRLRTLLSYSALFSLLALSQGWLPHVFSSQTVSYLLGANIALSSVVALYNLDILKKRYIADALSLSNLSCGLLAMHAASQGRYVVSLMLLLLGATFDGVDGAAARRWGSTRFGVYSDDIADAVNFGVGPGVAVHFAVGGIEGAVVGGLYAFFTVARLVYFTLNKDNADPAYFSGVPSPVGGVITLAGVVLFRDKPVLVGLLVGLSCALMVSFGSQYRHLGRLFAERPKLVLVALGLVVGAVVTGKLLGAVVPVTAMLIGCVAYGFLPVVRAFMQTRKTAAAA